VYHRAQVEASLGAYQGVCLRTNTEVYYRAYSQCTWKHLECLVGSVSQAGWECPIKCNQECTSERTWERAMKCVWQFY